ncbi:MAG: DUF3800 domain-containing protein [Phycisphaerae bacterium]|nr:DUF3800 domain-containing protein [Saprospiraceae bacterium]
MHFLYVDESGDPGVSRYGSRHYVLCGLVVKDDDWPKFLFRMKTFRAALKNAYGLKIRTEVHASELIRINKLADYRSIRKNSRLKILREYAQQIPIIFDTAKVIAVCLDKPAFPTNTDFQALAWQRLIERYDTYLKKNATDQGIIVADQTDERKIRMLLRKMRIYNPVKSHFNPGTYNAPVDNILEDVFQRDSSTSYFIQTIDVVAHLLYRKEYPKGSLKKFGVENLFDCVSPIILKEASKSDPLGILRK